MELTDEQLMLREATRGVLSRDAKIGRVREGLEANDRSAFFELERRQGWTAVGIPEDAGGQGGGPVELTILAEELGRAVLPSRFLSYTGLLFPALCRSGANEFLTDALANGVSAALVVSSERPPAVPGVVFDPANGLLNGAVRAVLDAAEADVLIVPSSEGLVAARRDDAGLVLVDRPLADRTRTSCDISFEGVAGEPVGSNRDFDPGELAPLTSLLVAADALGAAQRMLEMSVEYVKDREQFGRPVGSFQAVKHLAAEMLVNVEMSRSAVYHAAESLAADLEAAPIHAAAAKALTTEAAASAADTAIALHGAVGYTWEHDLHIFFKRAKLDVALFGQPSVHRETVASALDLPSCPPQR